MTSTFKIAAAFTARATLALLASAVVLSASVRPSWANDAEATQSQTRLVGIADLDLTQPAGQALLQKRLRRAARQVCESLADGASLSDRREAEACMATTLDQARTDARHAIAQASGARMVAAMMRRR